MENKNIDLRNLPKKMNGSKEVFDWMNSVGTKCKFKYYDVCGEVEIINYDRKKIKVTVKYKENILEMKTDHFINCKLGNLIGKFSKGWNFKIDDKIVKSDKGINITVIDRKLEKDKRGWNEKYIKYRCNDCGHEDWRREYRLMKGCHICNSNKEGISYPERVMISILNQLGVKYRKEYSPEWISPKRYDFYLPNYNVIIETHGAQHYKEMNYFQNDLDIIIEIDRLKEKIALKNNINNYIIIDCRNSEINWIKNNILKSKLIDILDLDKIDWDKCEEFALSNISKKVCDYWNNKKEFETVSDLCKEFKIGGNAIRRYLKKGTEIGLCNYNGLEEIKKSNLRRNF